LKTQLQIVCKEEEEEEEEEDFITIKICKLM